ncbi:hypothetical protein CBL_01212 [Carabus blaptoides fortunei]
MSDQGLHLEPIPGAREAEPPIQQLWYTNRIKLPFDKVQRLGNDYDGGPGAVRDAKISAPEPNVTDAHADGRATGTHQLNFLSYCPQEKLETINTRNNRSIKKQTVRS